MQTINQIRHKFANLLANNDYIIDKSGAKTIEIIAAHFDADQSSIFGIPNVDYINREIQWYENCSTNIKDIPGDIPKIWSQIADRDGEINSNYGFLIYSDEYHNQYNQVASELLHNRLSRRAVMIYTRPEIWNQYDLNGRNDFICTNTVQYFIRNDMLHVSVQMRSNDAVYGYKNDYAWQRHVQKRLCNDLNVKIGKIYWTVGSLHVYERHFHLIGETHV